MRFSTIIAPAFLAASVLAAPAPAPNFFNSFLGGFFGGCVSDYQAAQLVNGFHDILTNPNRQAANATAQAIIANTYTESSDSINSLAGFPLGSITFNGKTAFINGVVTAQAIPNMQTLAIYHDCNHITWRWVITGLGSGAQEVKGINVMTINSQGLIQDDNIEFNSIAWGADTGYTTLFPGQSCPA